MQNTEAAITKLLGMFVPVFIRSKIFEVYR
jgi:hypothetical protein